MPDTPDTALPVALITGASRGLGAALAEALAPGYHVVAVARTVGALEELDDRIKAKGGSATLAPMDVTDEGAMAHLCRGIWDRFGAARLWCHTAIHAAPLTPAAHVDPKDLEKSLDLNVRATAMLIRMIDPLLDRATGRAVFFDDPHGGEPFFGSYASTKAAGIALARAWAAESVRLGPRVEIATPRPMPTAVRARFFPGEDKSGLARPADEAARIVAELGLAAGD